MTSTPTLLAAAVIGTGLVASAGAAPITEDFDGETTGSQALGLVSQNSEALFSIVNQGVGDDALQVELPAGLNSIPGNPAGERARGQIADATAFSGFSVSASVSPERIRSSGGQIGVFAAASDQTSFNADLDLGYHARIRATALNFNATFVLELLDGETVLDSFDFGANGLVTGSFGAGTEDAVAFDLSLVGVVDGNGDLNLTATFTPDAADNPTGATLQVLSGTVDAVDVGLGAGLYGVQTSMPAGNPLITSFDDVAIDVTPIPEPGAAAAGLLGLGSLLARRSR
ncbi:MAG: hypothetical protein AAGI46_08650 [Planctomycetota bacterium]